MPVSTPYSTPALWGPNVASGDAVDFEAGVSGWAAGTQATSVASSTDQARIGTHSLKITKNSTASGYLAVTASDFPVAASTAYYLVAWMYTAQASAILKFDFDYYTSGSVYISSLSAAVPNTSLVANTWTPMIGGPFTTPATTAFIRPIPVMISGLSNTNTVYMDDLYMGRQLVTTDGMVTYQAVNRASTR